MLLNSASVELRETFARKLHSIILKPVGVASLLLAWCVGQAMAGGGIDAVKVPPAHFQLVSVSGTKPFAASPEDLSKKGYVEEEYYVTGTAKRYIFPDPMNNAAAV